MSEPGSRELTEDARARRCTGSASPPPSAAPRAAATVSALMLSSVPAASADSGLTTGIRPLSSSFFSTVVSTASMSPTKPKSTGPGSPATSSGGRRLCARTRPASTPLMPTASMVEVAAHAEHPRVDEPVEHHGGDVDRLRASVMRRPATMRVGTPSAADSLRELRAAAVHQHHAHAEVVQDRDLLDQRARGLRRRRTPRRRPSPRRSCPCTCGCRARRCAARGWRGSGRCGA